jgi:hypothetical protein
MSWLLGDGSKVRRGVLIWQEPRLKPESAITLKLEEVLGSFQASSLTQIC